MNDKMQRVLELARMLCSDMEADKHSYDKTLLEVRLLDAVEEAERVEDPPEKLLHLDDDLLYRLVIRLAEAFETSEEAVLEKLRKVVII